MLESRPAEPTEQCPNCRKWFKRGDCNHSSSVKTSWGGATLYGVCSNCAETHDCIGNPDKLIELVTREDK